MAIGGDTTIVNFSSTSSATRTFQRGSGGGLYTLSVTGTLSKGGIGALVFRQPDSSLHQLAFDINVVNVSNGLLAFGSSAGSASYVESVTIQSATLSGGTIQFMVGSTSGTADIDGNLDFTGAGTVRVRGLGSSASPQSGVLNVGSLTSTAGNGVIQANASTSGNAVTGLLRLNNATGTSTFSGIIQDGGTVGNVLSVEKNNAGTQVLSGVNTYTGATTINAGSLLVGAASVGSLGNTAVTVNEGTLGGTGSIAGAVAIGNGTGSGDALLSAGDGPGAIGTLTLANALSLDADADFVFEYNGTAVTADQVVANGVAIDALSVFSFSDIVPGVLADGTTFIVIDNTSGDAISGVFANLADGSTFVSGANEFAVSYSGGTGNDLVLTVVPEPATTALVGIGLASVLFFRRRH
jgi:autotransporter-associated beta strand protein